MSSFVIEGGHKLSGTIHPQGAKNEALEVISAVLLTSEAVTISNIPEILDVKNLISMLVDMGVKVTRKAKGEYSFKADNVDRSYVESPEFVRKSAALRGSVMLVGPLLSRFGRAYFPKPGGDKIGRRRVDTHLDGMVKLGASIEYNSIVRAYHLSAEDGLAGCYMLLDEASVTGTANIVMAAVLAEGKTTIFNAACEPYLYQLCTMLNNMGASAVFRHHLANEGQWVLQIRIHRHINICRIILYCGFHTCSQGLLVPEISGKAKAVHPGVPFMLFTYSAPRIVRTTVINKKHLPFVTGKLPLRG